MVIDFLPSVVLFLHVISVALALSLVLQTDYKFLRGQTSDIDIEKVGQQLFWLMLGLWFTGMALVFIKTGFDRESILANSKLVMKLVCVSVLTLNGYLLHRFSFRILNNRGPMTHYEAIILSANGAVSTSHWLLALFVGIARPLQAYPLLPLILIYIINLLTILLISLCISPFIKLLINSERAHITLISIGLKPGREQSDSNHPDQNYLLKPRLC